MVLAEECSRIGACRHGPYRHVRMRKQQPEQLSACITRCTCHCGPYSHPHDYAIHDKVMHDSVSRSEAVVFGASSRAAEMPTWSASPACQALRPDR